MPVVTTGLSVIQWWWWGGEIPGAGGQVMMSQIGRVLIRVIDL
jgi:hypothetical protein